MSLESEVIANLKEHKRILCTAESCTGGLIANLLTNISGASEVFWGSWVVYDNSAKLELGVSAEILNKHGAVSTETARSLAESGLKKLTSNPFRENSYSLVKSQKLLCLATTGIAGPGGGTPEKPVGLCYIGLAGTGLETKVSEIRESTQTARSISECAFSQSGQFRGRSQRQALLQFAFG